MSRPAPSSHSWFRTHRIPRSGRAGAALALLTLALGAGAAAWDPARSALAAIGAARLPARAASGAHGLARLVPHAPPPRIAIFTSVGIGLLAIPIVALGIRWRRRERELERLAMEERARVEQVFEAALVTRPLRRSPAAPAPDRQRGVPPLGPPPPEVASHAAALRATSVREAAARALLLRAASERSETRRRAAALRARARRVERTEPRASAGDATADPVAAPAAATATANSGTLLLAAEAGPSSTPATPARAADATPPRAAAAAAEPAEAPASAAPAGAETRRVALLASSGPLTFEWLERCLARDPEDFRARLDLCTALLVAERFADAERVARDGLRRDETDGRLLLRLSEALAGLDRSEEALEVALRAVRSHRSRKAVLHLTRLSALAHRFTPADGPRLRKALESRPSDPVFLHALGVFESLHGTPRHALTLLRLALRQERTPRWRRVVSREIARLRAEEVAAGAREPLRFVG